MARVRRRRGEDANGALADEACARGDRIRRRRRRPTVDDEDLHVRGARRRCARSAGRETARSTPSRAAARYTAFWLREIALRDCAARWIRRTTVHGSTEWRRGRDEVGAGDVKYSSRDRSRSVTSVLSFRQHRDICTNPRRSPSRRGRKRLRAAGRPIIDLGAGEPDFPTPRVRDRRGAPSARRRRDAVHVGRGHSSAPRGDRRPSDAVAAARAPVGRQLGRRVGGDRSRRCSTRASRSSPPATRCSSRRPAGRATTKWSRSPARRRSPVRGSRENGLKVTRATICARARTAQRAASSSTRRAIRPAPCIRATSSRRSSRCADEPAGGC